MPVDKDFKRLVRGRMQKTVAVGYERIKGLREIGQRRDGTYEASRSRTLPVPVARLYRAFTDPRVRNRWLPGIKLTIRKATPYKSVRGERLNALAGLMSPG